MGRKALKSRPHGWTISDLVRLPILIALGIWSIRADPTRHRVDLGILLVIGGVVLVGGLIRLLASRRCRICGGGSVGRITARPFGFHYLKCPDCGQRMKRSFWLGRIWDASGIEDELFFKPKTPPVITWVGESIEPLATPESRTVSGLLRGKLDRKSVAPGPVEIAPGELGWEGSAVSQSPSRPVRTGRRGVKQAMADAVFRTWDSIRWARNPPH